MREDISDGSVSAEAARSDYGVVLSATGILDEAAIARLRGDPATADLILKIDLAGTKEI